VIRIDAVWLALGASDLRCGIDKLLALVVGGFTLGAQAHHAYVFANRRADRLKVLVYDGSGLWLCTRRLQEGSFAWPRDASSGAMALTHEQLDWLVAGLPWQRLSHRPAQSITVV
jgi:transposase